MTDVIQLLPDSIANQIAAGEVIQRPASAVKELLENAIDAGASSVKLILKDAGKTLIQVIDDGCGMSETDARMSFERHATSKIRTSDDLFNIRTMGFRGEALASIASIAQVELRSRRRTDELGTKIVIEGFELKEQEPCQTPVGTNFQIKNLFFNVPARRNFLKSNTVEMRHVLDEFERVAIANPSVFMSLHHNGTEIFHLPAGNLRQRLVGVFGKETNKKLVPIQEETDVVTLTGFVGKPEFAKKTRGEQFFFVNNRFIKSQYLNHAVQAAFEDVIVKDAFPMYFIFIEIDPSRIDINVHPTKQEIKFEDERLVYNYLKVAVRHALGQNAVTPMLDFDSDAGLMNNYVIPRGGAKNNLITGDSFAPSQTVSSQFTKVKNDLNFKKPSQLERSNLENWQTLYDGISFKTEEITEDETDESFDVNTEFSFSMNMATVESNFDETEHAPELDDTEGSFSKQQREPYQIHNMYIVNHLKSGFILIDQQAASERILYERFLMQLADKPVATQKQLFPKTIYFSPNDAAVLREILPEINKLGFDIQEFGGESFIVHGLPSDWQGEKEEQKAIEKLLEQYKIEVNMKLDIDERIAATMARSNAIKRGSPLSILEMQELIDQLFACDMPFKSPSGRNCFITYDLESLQQQFLSQ
ncbi:MAG: DNA mismatch repair endonuclease MutL [Saprospiraceae bacterium]|nr:DNA mismatch repair endonuclease MutL [Saprospiraceae bacterium]